MGVRIGGRDWDCTPWGLDIVAKGRNLGWEVRVGVSIRFQLVRGLRS